MFIDLMDIIVTGKIDYSCEPTIEKDYSCRACDVNNTVSEQNQKSSSNNELFHDAKHTTKGVSPLVGQMFASMNV